MTYLQVAFDFVPCSRLIAGDPAERSRLIGTTKFDDLRFARAQDRAKEQALRHSGT
jgi:hypothetical protein